MVDVLIKLMENGKTPCYSRENDACLDCFSAEDVVIEKGKRKLINLGFAMELPHEWEAVVRPRSGKSKNGIDVCIGTIDETYRGELKANVVNNTNDDLIISFGEKICQLAIRPAPQINIKQVEELSETERGINGFGSSGN